MKCPRCGGAIVLVSGKGSGYYVGSPAFIRYILSIVKSIFGYAYKGGYGRGYTGSL